MLLTSGTPWLVWLFDDKKKEEERIELETRRQIRATKVTKRLTHLIAGTRSTAALVTVPTDRKGQQSAR